MDFSLLQIAWVKAWAINMVKRFSTVLKKSSTDPIKPASKRAINKTAEATDDLISNKIADKTTNA